METRYHMQKGGLMVEARRLVILKDFRKRSYLFKRARIKKVLQAFPNEIKLGVIYEVGTTPPVEIGRIL